MRQKLFQCDEGDGVGTFVTDGDMEPFCSEPGGGFGGASMKGELRSAVFSGENFNFGLVDCTDRPYDEMIAEVKRSNARLEAVHAGRETPFRLENPEKLLFSNQKRKLLADFLPDSSSKFITVDKTNAQEFFGGCEFRLKVDEHLLPQNADPAAGYPVGTARAGDNSRFRSVKADCYFWNKHRGRDLNLYYALEGSPDNLNFSALPLKFELVRKAEFDHYIMRNAQPIPPEVRYLRVVLKAPVQSESWSNQIAGIEIEH